MPDEVVEFGIDQPIRGWQLVRGEAFIGRLLRVVGDRVVVVLLGAGTKETTLGALCVVDEAYVVREGADGYALIHHGAEVGVASPANPMAEKELRLPAVRGVKTLSRSTEHRTLNLLAGGPRSQTLSESLSVRRIQRVFPNEVNRRLQNELLCDRRQTCGVQVIEPHTGGKHLPRIASDSAHI